MEDPTILILHVYPEVTEAVTATEGATITKIQTSGQEEADTMSPTSPTTPNLKRHMC